MLFAIDVLPFAIELLICRYLYVGIIKKAVWIVISLLSFLLAIGHLTYLCTTYMLHDVTTNIEMKEQRSLHFPGLGVIINHLMFL